MKSDVNNRFRPSAPRRGAYNSAAYPIRAVGAARAGAAGPRAARNRRPRPRATAVRSCDLVQVFGLSCKHLSKQMSRLNNLLPFTMTYFTIAALLFCLRTTRCAQVKVTGSLPVSRVPCVSRLPPVFGGFKNCGYRTVSPTQWWGAAQGGAILEGDTSWGSWQTIPKSIRHTAYRFPRRILLHVRNNNAACFELVAAAGGRIQHEQLNSTRLLLGMPMLPNGSTRLPNGHIGLDKD